MKGKGDKTMDIMEKMEAAKPKFTKTDLKIYELVKAESQYIARTSTAMITADYGLSQAALTRFSQKLGYNGYNEFKYEISRHSHKTLTVNGTKDSPMEVYIKNFRYFEELYQEGKCQEAADVISRASRVYITGYHRSYLAAELLNYNLLDFCYDSMCLRADEIFKIDAFSREGSLLIIFSVSNPTYLELVSEIGKMKRNKPKIMLVTLSEKHPLSKRSDYVYVLPNLRSAPSHYIEPMVMFSAFIQEIAAFLSPKNE
ncbi:MAG: MurR/RpiR family transcriptional regulator [Hungatella sp.]|nr:MurR/RpiR family transcriptional regulator [Hungatella sp.]